MKSGMDIRKLQASAKLLRERVEKTDSSSLEMISILSSFDSRLSSLEADMRPTQIRAHAYRKTHENIDLTMKKTEEILSKFDIPRKAEAVIKEGPKRDLEGYLQTVDRLNDAVDFFTRNRQFKSSDTSQLLAKELLKEAHKRLEEDFTTIVTANSKPIDPGQVAAAFTDTSEVSLKEDSSRVLGAGEDMEGAAVELKSGRIGNLVLTVHSTSLPEFLPPPAVKRLQAIASLLVTGGHSLECITTFREVREKCLESSLRRLGIDKPRSEDILKLKAEDLEARIGAWNKHMKQMVLVVFPSEKRLCDSVFSGLDPFREQLFANIVESAASTLLIFGEIIARMKRSAEKLFVMLDMYETLRELIPHVDSVFGSSHCTRVRDSAHVLLQRLGQIGRETLIEFEEAIEKDASKTLAADGAVHPLTRYVINYVKFLFEYHVTLEELLQKEERYIPQQNLPMAVSGPLTPGTESGVVEDPHLAVAVARIMAVLQSNLDSKSKSFKEPALGHIFLMNNVHYMVKSIRKSNAMPALGDDWVQRQRRIVQQHSKEYQRAAWYRVVQIFSMGVDSASISRNIVKEKFRTFNAMFEDLHQRQCHWSIQDNELRSAVQLQVAEILVPAYLSFVNRHGKLLNQTATFGKTPNPNKYIKYKPEDLEAMLSEMFDGKAKAPVKS